MSEAAIEVEGLGKSYRLGRNRGQYRTLRESIIAGMRNPLALLSSRKSRARETIWALKDVSFQVASGEVVGVIGRNGAGKSTLLKVLSRITSPTEGHARLRGRLRSLLEVGTGFHPELTGRENIFLNGALLGMSRTEIVERFDDIVGFSEIEKFLDTPVKHYSSGMYVRLAFSIAAHLEPDILLVDEVLAVGDAGFQKKCIGKIRNVSREGRTVLFVSHDMSVIASMTSRSLYFDGGRIVASGDSRDIVSRYLSDVHRVEGTNKPRLDGHYRRLHGNSPVRFLEIWANDHPSEIAHIGIGEDITFCFKVEADRSVRHALLTMIIRRHDGAHVCSLLSQDYGFTLELPPGEKTLRCRIRALPLPPGEYSVSAGLNQSFGTVAWDVIEDYPVFRVSDRTNVLSGWTDRPWGAVHWNDVTWEYA